MALRKVEASAGVAAANRDEDEDEFDLRRGENSLFLYILLPVCLFLCHLRLSLCPFVCPRVLLPFSLCASAVFIYLGYVQLMIYLIRMICFI